MGKADELKHLASQAEELVENLQKLQQRIGDYGAAREDLHTATESLVDLSAELQRVSKKANSIIQKLDQIDAVSLAKQLSAIGVRLEELGSALAVKVDSANARLEKTLVQQTTIKRISVLVLLCSVAIIALLARSRLK